jgi:hypothetical protein
MDALPKISPDRLKALLHQQVDEFAEKLVDEANAAAAGRLIADSEEGVRRLIQAFGQSAYEALLQQKIDAAEASFPPSGGNDDRPRQPPSGAKTSAE